MVKATSDSASELANQLRKGDELYRRGRLREAISEWTKASRIATESGWSDEQIALLVRRSEAYRSLGFFRRAIDDLQAASALADAAENNEMRARI